MTDILYRLHHAYENEYGSINRTSLGIYSARELAEKAQAHYVMLPGFCDYPDDFVIEPVTLEETAWTEGFVPVSDNDDEAKAVQAAARMAARATPPLRHHVRPAPNGYWIYELRRGKTSLGCEVGRIGGAAFAHGLVEAAAYHRALEHAKSKQDPYGHKHDARDVPQSFFRSDAHEGEDVEIFQLWHVYETHDGDDEEKWIGLYRTREAAEKARAHAATLPGFRDYPEAFYIRSSSVDECSWSDGFVTIITDLQEGAEEQAAARAAARAMMPVARYDRPAPDGYWIDELWYGEALFGYSVGRMDEPAFADGLVEATAYQCAVDDAIARSNA